MQIKIGEKIRVLRHRDGCTQEELSRELGLTSQAVSRWESNLSYPNLEIIPKIANYFHISIDELFGYDNDRRERMDKILSDVSEMKKAQQSPKKSFNFCEWHVLNFRVTLSLPLSLRTLL